MKVELNKKVFIIPGLLIFHMGISVLMSWVVRTSHFLSFHAGLGLWNFAGDSIKYHENAIRVMNFLEKGDYVGWWGVPELWHVKLISLDYAVMGANPLLFAPVNAMAWAISVMIVHRIVCEIFPDRQKLAVFSALIFGLCPSYLLHTTQLLKEPFYVLGIVMMIRGWIGLMSGSRSFSLSLFVGIGVLLACLNRTFVLLPLIVFSLLGIAVVLLRTRHAWAHVLLAFSLLVGVYALEQERRAVFKSPRAAPLSEMIGLKTHANPEEEQQSVSSSLWRHFFTVAHSRDFYNFGYAGAGSNIDSEIRFKEPADVVRYIPRALQVGFFAPFPGHWVEQSKTAGRFSRILAGIEMTGWYTLMLGFAYFLISGKPALEIRVWLSLFCVGMVLLTSLVVTNIGALMRMRFVYFLPIIIGGMEGWARLILWKKGSLSEKRIHKPVHSIALPFEGREDGHV